MPGSRQVAELLPELGDTVGPGQVPDVLPRPQRQRDPEPGADEPLLATAPVAAIPGPGREPSRRLRDSP
jgi:hypothetical protein